MKFACEIVANKILPAIRAELSIRLFENYNLKQIEISKLLGITQGAVSHYITCFRGKQREIIKKYPEIENIVNEMAYKIAKGEMDINDFCKFCSKIRELISSSNSKHSF